MKRIFLFFALMIVGLNMIGCDKSRVYLFEDDSIGSVYSLNMVRARINETCLKTQINSLLSAFDLGQTVPFRVKVFRDHPLVKEILSMEYLLVERKNNQKFVIPLDSRKLLVIVNDNYILHAPRDDFKFNISECFS